MGASERVTRNNRRRSYNPRRVESRLSEVGSVREMTEGELETLHNREERIEQRRALSFFDEYSACGISAWLQQKAANCM